MNVVIFFILFVSNILFIGKFVMVRLECIVFSFYHITFSLFLNHLHDVTPGGTIAKDQE